MHMYMLAHYVLDLFLLRCRSLLLVEPPRAGASCCSRLHVRRVEPFVCLQRLQAVECFRHCKTDSTVGVSATTATSSVAHVP